MASGKTNASGAKTLPGTASPSDVRMGKTFSRDGKNLEVGSLNLTNLKAENIKKGVTIGGVVGNYTEPERPFKRYFSGNIATNLPYTFDAGTIDFYPSKIVMNFNGILIINNWNYGEDSYVFSSVGTQYNNIHGSTSKIQLSASRQGNSVKITISNSGSGSVRLDGRFSGYIFK